MSLPSTPEAGTLRLRRWAWGGVVVATLAAAALAAAPPFVPEGTRAGLMRVFAPLCHQLVERSFAVGGVPLALCHRCFGVALGFALGALLVPVLVRALPARLHPARDDGRVGLGLLALAAVPMGADWALDALGVWANAPTSRVATGLAFGAVAGTLLAGAVGYGGRGPKGKAGGTAPV